MSTPTPARRLPLLAAHEDPLQRCVYCPKLCRASCPVSEADGRESVTPWGKMSTAWFLSRGDVPLEPGHAALAWACSGCHACKERCDHGNEVAHVLSDARADAFALDLAPAPAQKVAREFEALEHETTAAAERLANRVHGEAAPRGRVAVVVGCSYLRHLPEVAEDALAATEALLGGAPGRDGAPGRPVTASPVGGCCGLPLLHAGDRNGFERAARRMATRLRDADEVVVVDPGCARAMMVEYPRVGVTVRPPRLFVDLAAEATGRMRPWKDADPSAPPREPPRWHDPCQLGRGLGRYEQPRRVLEAVAGAPPREHARKEAMADCSGGGGLLPVTRPATSQAMAEARLEEHHRLGGGVLVTGCAESLRRFRASGEPAEDLATWVARGLDVARR